jgi:ABC-2 type transport system permease protein
MNQINKITIITKREFGEYIGSPIAYIFLIAYLLLSGIITFTLGNLFERNEASLWVFFSWMPWLLLFFAPAIGMRLWAEEKKSGTIEFLLTLPITPIQAIIGKFLGSWFFLIIAILLSFPMIITVNLLGSPDNGAIVTGYLGCFLLSGTYLAIVCLASSLTKNQVSAFILAFSICLVLILIGYPPVTDILARWLEPKTIEGIANFSILAHFDSFERGMIDTRDFIYFFSLMIFSLFLNDLAIKNARA